jgi:hypothetical protein
MSVESEEDLNCVICNDRTDNYCDQCKHYICHEHTEVKEWLSYEGEECETCKKPGCLECVYTCYSCANHSEWYGWYHKTCKTLKDVCVAHHEWYVCEKTLHGDQEEGDEENEKCGECVADRNYCRKHE